MRFWQRWVQQQWEVTGALDDNTERPKTTAVLEAQKKTWPGPMVRGSYRDFSEVKLTKCLAYFNVLTGGDSH